MSGHDHDHHHHDHGNHGDDDEGIDIVTFKIIMLFVMLFCVGFGIIPKVCPAC